MRATASADTHVQRIGHGLITTIVLATAVPLSILAYLTWGVVVPGIAPADTAKSIGIQLLAAVAAAGIVAGGYAIWVLTQRLARTTATPVAEMLPDHTPAPDASIAELRATIERQAAELTGYHTRLEEAQRELESTNARFRETSFKDDVTGLYNRRFFSVRLEEELSRHRRFNHPVAVVLFDLDGFKAVNDDLGHVVGDETLRDIGQILMKHSRGINVVARYGGDEFAILLVETSKAGARLYADRIRQVISSYPYSHGKRITASFGVASLPDDEALTSEDLIRVADEALYKAKRAGKNQVAAAHSHDARR
jgi:diguanylate cyclase (GGDEF)-like protein